MGVYLEDGLYIVANNLLPCIVKEQSEPIRESINEMIRNSGTRATRFKIQKGVPYWMGHDFLSYYQKLRHYEYYSYKIISHPDQLQTGLLPYSERS